MKLGKFVIALIGAAFQPGAEYVYHDVENGDAAAGWRSSCTEEEVHASRSPWGAGRIAVIMVLFYMER